MLGSCFLKYLSGNKDFEMYAFDRETLDISDFDKLTEAFKRISPDFVLNCAAFTNVDACEEESGVAMDVNGMALGVLARACKNENAILVHFSTDYVFDGENSEGYVEEDRPNPLNIYGKSKLKGEELIQKESENFYIIRTSWLFGEGGRNFVTTMLELAKTRDELDVVGDQVGSPTYTKDLCDAVVNYFLYPFISDLEDHHARTMKEEAGSCDKLPFGIYHLTNSGTTSWFEFARYIFQARGLDIKVNEVSSEVFVRPAIRPRCSILRNTKIPNLKIRGWQDAVKAYMALL
jgi:dTDP-4-dehydrorhamnose reductase